VHRRELTDGHWLLLGQRQFPTYGGLHVSKSGRLNRVRTARPLRPFALRLGSIAEECTAVPQPCA